MNGAGKVRTTKLQFKVIDYGEFWDGPGGARSGRYREFLLVAGGRKVAWAWADSPWLAVAAVAGSVEPFKDRVTLDWCWA